MRTPPWLDPPVPVEQYRRNQERRRQTRAAFKRRRDAGLRKRHTRKDNPRPDEQTGGSNQHNRRSIA